jgi:hypothetical protein
MGDAGDVFWEGKSGTSYEYWIVPLATNDELINEPGNFILAKKTKQGLWEPVFIGQTADLGTLLQRYRSEECVQDSGATHIHVHPGWPDESRRVEEVQDLVEEWNPVCNE